eukprot:3024303-Pleurochrysis_carterae.AAC.2
MARTLARSLTYSLAPITVSGRDWAVAGQFRRAQDLRLHRWLQRLVPEELLESSCNHLRPFATAPRHSVHELRARPDSASQGKCERRTSCGAILRRIRQRAASSAGGSPRTLSMGLMRLGGGEGGREAGSECVCERGRTLCARLLSLLLTLSASLCHIASMDHLVSATGRQEYLEGYNILRNGRAFREEGDGVKGKNGLLVA